MYDYGQGQKTPHLFGLFPDATFSFLVRSEWNSQKANREGITVAFPNRKSIIFDNKLDFSGNKIG